MKRFLKTFSPGSETRIIDVGGTTMNWELVDCSSNVTLLNLSVPPDPTSHPPEIHFVQGNGTHLNYPDKSFDIAFSNSVIEHLHNFENQLKFAREIMRVGKRIWVQTPARWFFVEPHLITAFVHYLPRKWQKHLIRNFTVWGLVTRPTRETVDRFLDEIRPLTHNEMKQLFPDCQIRKERFLFFTKSYIAVRTSN